MVKSHGQQIFLSVASHAEELTLLGALQTADGKKVESAALYNLTDNTYERFHITESPLCSSHVLLPNGEAAIVGGKLL